MPLHIWKPLLPNKLIQVILCLNIIFSCSMSDITFITSFLDILTPAVSLVIIITSTYFTCLCNSNARFLRGKAFSYVMGLLPIIFKLFSTVIQGTGPSPNPKSPTLHTPYTVGLLSLYSNLFSLGNSSSLHHKVIFLFAFGYSFSLVTVAVSYSAELSDPDSMGINSQKPTTNFAWTVTLIFFL